MNRLLFQTNSLIFQAMTTVIWVIISLLAVWTAILLWADYRKNGGGDTSWAKTGLIGFVANFFDTLGIGSFAIETALLRFSRQVSDKELPGTLNVANAIPTALQGIIFVQIVEVEPLTLLTMLASAGAGALTGAGIVAKLSQTKIQLAMGLALMATAFFMVASNLNWISGAGTATSLEGFKLVIGIAVNFLLGALMTVGVGLYAPCMALVFALGMSPAVAFPIMMGSCAVLMPLASWKFIKAGAYSRRTAVATSICGIGGVLIAAFIVKSLSVDLLRWLVILVVVYTAAVMLKAGIQAVGKKL